MTSESPMPASRLTPDQEVAIRVRAPKFSLERYSMDRIDLLAELDAVRADNERLRAALESFAKVSDRYAVADKEAAQRYAGEGRPYQPRSDSHRVEVALGECRKARVALAKEMKS